MISGTSQDGVGGDAVEASLLEVDAVEASLLEVDAVDEELKNRSSRFDKRLRKEADRFAGRCGVGDNVRGSTSSEDSERGVSFVARGD